MYLRKRRRKPGEALIAAPSQFGLAQLHLLRAEAFFQLVGMSCNRGNYDGAIDILQDFSDKLLTESRWGHRYFQFGFSLVVSLLFSSCAMYGSYASFPLQSATTDPREGATAK